MKIPSPSDSLKKSVSRVKNKVETKEKENKVYSITDFISDEAEKKFNEFVEYVKNCEAIPIPPKEEKRKKEPRELIPQPIDLSKRIFTE